ncbi:MAG: inorganic diphosphatase [Myxococcota bacterium]
MNEPAPSVRLPDRGDVLEVCVQTPRGSFWKRDDFGRRSLPSPFPVPFNYGFVPGWPSADGDQLDALLLGSRVERGGKRTGTVLGVVAFRDQGVPDPKVILRDRPGTRLAAWERRTFELFFHLYGGIKRGLRPGRPSGFEGWIVPPA